MWMGKTIWANLQTKFAQIADQIRRFCFAISPKLLWYVSAKRRGKNVRRGRKNVLTDHSPQT